MRRLTSLSVSTAFHTALAECMGKELLAEKSAFVRARRIRLTFLLAVIVVAFALLLFSIYH